MKKTRLFYMMFAFLPLSYIGAQHARSITNVIADAVTTYLSPYGGKGQPGEKVLVLHFKSPTPALNDWAVDRFT